MEMHRIWDRILAVYVQMASLGIHLPSNLADMDVSSVRATAHELPLSGCYQAIWSISRSPPKAALSCSEYFAHGRAIFTQDSLLRAIRRHSAKFAAAGRISIRTKRKLNAQRPLPRLGPAHRTRMLKSPDVVPRAVGRFIKDATQGNRTRQAKGSYPGTASAFRCYAAFCELRKVPPSPASEEVAIQRNSLFSNIATYENYVASSKDIQETKEMRILRSGPMEREK